MTKNELNKLFYINREIGKIKEEIENLTYLSASKLRNTVVQSSGSSDATADIACRLGELKSLYDIKLQELFIRKAEIERFLNTIKEDEARLIFRLRHVNCLTWEQIGYEINCDGSWARRKYNKLASVLIRQENQKQM